MEGEIENESNPNDGNRENTTSVIEKGAPQGAPVASATEIPQTSVPHIVNESNSRSGRTVYRVVQGRRNHGSRRHQSIYRKSNGRRFVENMVIFSTKTNKCSIKLYLK